MKIDSLLFILACSLVAPTCIHGAPYPLRASDGGTCRTYPETGAICSDYLGGMNVFEWSEISMEDYNAFMEGYVLDLDAQVKMISTAACIDAFKKFICMSYFPPCTEDGQPRRICKSTCELVNDDICAAAFAVVTSVGKAHMVPKCTNVMGDPATSEAHVYYEYLKAWEGTVMFPADEEDPTCADLSVSKEAACKPKQCAPILAEYRTPISADPQSGVPLWVTPGDTDFCKGSSGAEEYDCAKCDSWCGVQCLYPEVYSETTYTLLHVFTALPGLVSGPLNMLVIYVELRKLQALKKPDFTDYFIFISALLSIWLFLTEAIPSAIIGKDMRCNGEAVYSWEYDLDQEHAVCKVGKLRLHVLQAIYFCVVGTLYKVDRQLSASLNMKKYNPSQGIRFFFMFLIVLVPSALALCTIALDADQLYEISRQYRISLGGPPKLKSLQTANRLRYAFTCGPRFEGTGTELAVIHFPLVLAGVASFMLSARLLYVVFVKMGAHKTGSSNGAKQKKSKNNALAKLAMNMIRFAFITTMLTFINVTATVLFVPQSVEFGQQMTTWEQCSITGVNWRAIRDENGVIFGDMNSATRTNLTTMQDYYDHCGSFDEFKPDAGLLMMIVLSNGLPSMAFGFIFALPAIKQLQAMVKSKMTQVTPSAVSGTSAASYIVN